METKIAVVGMGCLFPDASNVDEFWNNVSTGRVSIRPLPGEMLEGDVDQPPRFVPVHELDFRLQALAV